jgi:hypothetical protein
MIGRNKIVGRALLLTTVACVALFGATRARARGANQAEIVTGFSAKETCSCAHAADQSDAYCKDFGTPAGFQLDIAIDHEARTATAKFLGVSRTARFSEGAGCLLDPLP